MSRIKNELSTDCLKRFAQEQYGLLGQIRLSRTSEGRALNYRLASGSAWPAELTRWSFQCAIWNTAVHIGKSLRASIHLPPRSPLMALASYS